METGLTTADYITLTGYLIIVLAIGLWLSRKIRTGSDYFLAGKSLPWWAIGMSLVATDIGGTDIIGVGGAAYSHGLAVGNFEWIGCVPAMIIGAFVFIPFFWRIGVYTIPEYMEKRYNAGVRTALAICWLLFMACNLGVMLFASAKMMSVLLDIDQTTCIWMTAILVGLYTVIGGLAAVVYTDAIQCFVMIAGCLLIAVYGIIDVGGIGPLQEQLKSAEQTSLVLPVDTETPFPWTGILFGLAFILSPAYWIGNQAIVQRSLGAKSEFQAKAAYIWGALLKNLVPFIIVIPGLIAVVKFPELKDGDTAIPNLVGALLPAGLRGIFMGAFVAALMSSIDSYLNSASTILTNDIYKRFMKRDATDRHLLWIGRLTTIALLAWAVYFAFQLVTLSEQTGIYAIFQTLMAFFQGPALAILMGGLLWRRATGKAAFIGFLGGILCSVTLYALNQSTVYEQLELKPLFQISEPFLYFSIWAFLTSLTILIVGSLMSKSEPEEKLAYMIRGAKKEPAQ